MFLTKYLYPVGKHQTLKLYLSSLYNHTYLENYFSLKVPVYNCFVTVSEPIQYTTHIPVSLYVSQWPGAINYVIVYFHKGLKLQQICTEYMFILICESITAHFCQWHFGTVGSIDGQQL